MFIEGGTTGADFDGIAIAAPNATVEVVNVRVEDVHGHSSGFHGDIIQPFGGVKKFYVDGLTGRSNYQGFSLQETGGQIGSVSLNNVNLSYDSNSYDTTTSPPWSVLHVPGDAGQRLYPASQRAFYGAQRRVSEHGPPFRFRARQSGSDVTWPTIGAIDGKVIQGRPSSGDFVPAGSVG